MKRLMIAVLAAMLLLPAARAADGPDAEAKYQAMLAAAKENPAATDWQALRFAYAERPSFSPFAVDNGRKAMLEAREVQDWDKLLAVAKEVIDINYTDGAGHLWAAVAYAAFGKVDDSKREDTIAKGIFKSMMPNGDGKSREHAFVVISVAEEYELMQLGRFHPTQQHLVNEAGHAYDVLDATGRNGKSATFWFQIDRVMAAEARALGKH